MSSRAMPPGPKLIASAARATPHQVADAALAIALGADAAPTHSPDEARSRRDAWLVRPAAPVDTHLSLPRLPSNMSPG